MSADDLISSLASEGALVVRGEFKLDRAKARQKMQKFQLSDPQRYVLELVQAAAILGATRIDFTIDTDEMLMTFDGQTLSHDDLDQLYNAPFSNLRDDRTEALRHIAIGLTAARAMNPSVMTIESGTLENTLMLSHDPKVNDEVISKPPKPWTGKEVPTDDHDKQVPGTRIYVKEQLRSDHVFEWFRSLSGEWAEVSYLRKHCHRAPFGVFVNGREIRSDWHLGDACTNPIETEFEQGKLELTQNLSFHVEVLQHGVLITNHTGFSEPIGYQAIVDSKRLRKDLSQTAFIEDDAWMELTNEVIPQVFFKALRQRYRNPTIAISPGYHGEMKNIFAGLVREMFDEDGTEIDAETREFMDELAESLIWPIAYTPNRSAVSWVGDQQFAPASHFLISSGAIKVATKRFKGLIEYDDPVLLLSSPDQPNDVHKRVGPIKKGEFEEYIGPIPKSDFRKYFKRGIQDVTNELEDAQHRAKNKSQWEMSKFYMSSVTVAQNVQVASRLNDFEIHLVMNVRTRTNGRIYWVKDGRLLAQQNIKDDIMDGLSIVVSGDIPTNARWDGPASGEWMAEVAAEVCNLIPKLMDEVAVSQHATACMPEVKTYLENLVRGRLHTNVHYAFSSDERAHVYLAAVEDDSPYMFAKVGQASRLDAVDLLGEVAQLPMFRTLAEDEKVRAVSIAAVQAEYQASHAVRTIHRRHLSDVLKHYQMIGDGRFVLVADDDEERLLLRFFGNVFQPAQTELRRDAARIEFEKKPQVDLKLPRKIERYVSWKEHEYDRTKFVIGMPDDRPSEIDPNLTSYMAINGMESGIVAAVLVDGRPIDFLNEPFPFGRFEAVVESGDVNPRADFTGILKDRDRKKLVSRLEDHAHSLQRAWLKEETKKPIQNRAASYWRSFEAYLDKGHKEIEQLDAFEDDAGRKLDLAGVRRRMNGQDTVYLVNFDADVFEEMVGSDELVLRDGGGIPWSKLFSLPVENVSKTDDVVRRQEEARRLFYARTMESMKVDDATAVARVDVETEFCEGQVALLLDTVPQRIMCDASIGLYHAFRYLKHKKYFVPFGAFAGKLEFPGIKLDRSWQEIEELPSTISKVVLDTAEKAIVAFVQGQKPGMDDAGTIVRDMMLAYIRHATLGTNNAPNLWPDGVNALLNFPMFEKREGGHVSYQQLLDEPKIIYGASPDAMPDEGYCCLVTPADQLMQFFRRDERLNVQSLSQYLSAQNLKKAADEFEQRNQPLPDESVQAIIDSIDAEPEPVEEVKKEPEVEAPKFTEAEQQGLSSLKAALVAARGDEHFLISDDIVARIHLWHADDKRVCVVRAGDYYVNTRHSLFASMAFDKPASVGMLASAVYSEINRDQGRITDLHEAYFQSLLTEWTVQQMHRS